MDNENHSDFDPLCAPNWSVQVFSKDTRHLLSQHFVQFLKTCKSTTNISELIGDLLKRKNFNGILFDIEALDERDRHVQFSNYIWWCLIR